MRAAAGRSAPCPRQRPGSRRRSITADLFANVVGKVETEDDEGAQLFCQSLKPSRFHSYLTEKEGGAASAMEVAKYMGVKFDETQEWSIRSPADCGVFWNQLLYSFPELIDWLAAIKTDEHRERILKVLAEMEKVVTIVRRKDIDNKDTEASYRGVLDEYRGAFFLGMLGIPMTDLKCCSEFLKSMTAAHRLKQRKQLWRAASFSRAETKRSPSFQELRKQQSTVASELSPVSRQLGVQELTNAYYNRDKDPGAVGLAASATANLANPSEQEELEANEGLPPTNEFTALGSLFPFLCRQGSGDS